MRTGHSLRHVSPMDQYIVNAAGRPVGFQDHRGIQDFYWLSGDEVGIQAGTHRYVDFRTAANGGKGANTNDGLSWDTPYLTMAKALSVCADFDVISFIGRCEETNLTPATGAEYVTIQGGGPHPRVNAMWKPTGPGINVISKGWMFRNFKAEPVSGQPLILATQRAAGSWNGSDGMIVNVEQNGGGSLITGVDVDRWSILGVDAHDAENAILVPSVAESQAYGWLIAGCRFMNNDNHVIAKLAEAVIQGNYFQHQGHSKTATTKLSLLGGSGGNVVTDNFVGGTFSIAGGYKASDGAVADEWCNNRNNGGFREGRPA